jgi:glycosyltransferase involved in cell wall biosynthesis
MRLLLIPDPTSPNGEDAFCREIAKRAAARSHHASIQAIPNGPLEATLQRLSATGFALSSDLVVVNSLQPAALLAAKAAGKKAAVRLIDSYVGASQAALAEVLRLCKEADLVLVPSDHMAGVVRAWGLNGSVRRVPYAYDRIMAQQIALVTVRASRQAFQLVSASELNETTRPGFDTLLTAIARLRLDCHLMIIGEGPALPALQERARQLMVTQKVAFMPPMEHAKMMEFFRAAKAYVDPCGLEGFPTLSLHALSEGCPVIAPRAGATLELIADGVNGLLFTPGDALSLSEQIVTLSSERGLSLRLIGEGIKTVGGHTWDRTVETAFEAFESVEGAKA